MPVSICKENILEQLKRCTYVTSDVENVRMPYIYMDMYIHVCIVGAIYLRVLLIRGNIYFGGVIDTNVMSTPIVVFNVPCLLFEPITSQVSQDTM